MTLADAVVAHDVQDAHADGVAVPPAPRQPRQRQPRQLAARRVLGSPRLNGRSTCLPWSLDPKQTLTRNIASETCLLFNHSFTIDPSASLPAEAVCAGSSPWATASAHSVACPRVLWAPKQAQDEWRVNGAAASQSYSDDIQLLLDRTGARARARGGGG